MATPSTSGRSLLWAAGLVLAAVCMSSCGNGDGVPATATPSAQTTTTPAQTSTIAALVVPTPDELAAGRLTAEDLGGTWAVASELMPSRVPGGVVTEEIREQLPTLEMCPEAGAEAAAAAAAVEWQAVSTLTRPSATAEWPIILGQFLFAGEPAEIEDIFLTLKEASVVCAGSEQTLEGATEVSESMPVPPVGDDRFGIRVSISDAETDTYLSAAFVRDGAIFMFLDLWETTIPGAAPDLTQDEADTIISTAVAKLP
jgi:hypothetical protein